MYQHIKSLKKLGADVPYGTTMQREGDGRKPPPQGRAVDPKDTAAVASAAIRTSVSQVGAGRVAGFGGPSGPSKSIHNHEDAFQRRKGVVNTVGGAKDINIKREEEGGIHRGHARIVTMDTVETLGAEGQARIAARARREAAAAGGRPPGAPPVSGGGVHVTAPTRRPPPESRVARPRETPLHAPKVGGVGGGDGAGRTSGTTGSKQQQQTAAAANRATTTTRKSTHRGDARSQLSRGDEDTDLDGPARPLSDRATAAAAAAGTAGAAAGVGVARRGGVLVDTQNPLAAEGGRRPAVSSSSRSAATAPAAAVPTVNSNGRSEETRAAMAAHRAAYFATKFEAEDARKAELRAAAAAADG